MVSLLKYVEQMVLDDISETDISETVISRNYSTLIITMKYNKIYMRVDINFKFTDNEDLIVKGYLSLDKQYENNRSIYWNMDFDDSIDSLIENCRALGFVYDFDTRISKNWNKIYMMTITWGIGEIENRKREDKIANGKDEDESDNDEKYPRTPQANVVQQAISVPYANSVPPTPKRLNIRLYKPNNIPEELISDEPVHPDVKFYIVISNNFILRTNLKHEYLIVGKDIDGTMVPFTRMYINQVDFDIVEGYGLKIDEMRKFTAIKSTQKR